MGVGGLTIIAMPGLLLVVVVLLPVQMVDVETGEVLDAVLPGPTGRRSVPGGSLAEGSWAGDRGEALTEWPLRSLDEADELGMGQQQPRSDEQQGLGGRVWSDGSVTDFRDAISDYRHGLQGEDDFHVDTNSTTGQHHGTTDGEQASQLATARQTLG